MAKDIIIFWKGSAESYATLKLRGRIKPFGRYTVTSSDGTVREYLGTKLIGNSNLEQLAFVDDLMSTSLPTHKYNSWEHKKKKKIKKKNKKKKNTKIQI